MSLKPLTLAVGVALSACAAPHHIVVLDEEKPLAPVSARLPITAPSAYPLLDAARTGIKKVSDDGEHTAFEFEVAPPPGLMLFDEEGAPMWRFTRKAPAW